MENNEALKRVIKSAMYADGLVRGLRKSVQMLEKREALFCLLNSSVDEPAIGKLVRALCFHNDIPLLEIEGRSELGKLVEQCSYDKSNNARKISGCSVAVVTNFGKDSGAADEVEKLLHKKGAKSTATAMEE